jgi:hypothetical protein
MAYYKFKKDDKCVVVENLLAPHCVGYIVTIKGCYTANGRNFYNVLHENGLMGIAAESCLELQRNYEEKMFDM